MSCQEVSKFILIGLTVLAWIFAIITVAHCAFIQIDGIQFGLFKFGFEGVEGSCSKYSSVSSAGLEFEGTFKAARAFGVLTTLFVSFAMVLVVVAVIFVPKKPMWTCYRVLMSFSFIFNFFTFLVFAECVDDSYNDNIYGDYSLTCTMGTASIIGTINSALLLATSIMSCVVPLPEEPVFKNLTGCNTTQGNNASNVDGVDQLAHEIVNKTIEETPQGTKITEEVIDANGNKTITTTIQQHVQTEQPSNSSRVIAGLTVGPIVKMAVEDIPNGSKKIEEDADGNKIITTTVVVMAVSERARGTNVNDGNYETVMASAVPLPVYDSRQIYNSSQDEEEGMTNPYLHAQEDPPPPSSVPQDSSTSLDHSASSFAKWENFDDSCLGNSSALDGTGERKRKKKKKHKHHHREGEHHSSRKDAEHHKKHRENHYSHKHSSEQDPDGDKVGYEADGL